MYLSEEHEKFRKEICDYIREKVLCQIDEYEEKEVLPRALLEDMGERGYLGIPFPAEYGGKGLDNLSFIIAVEEFSRVWGSLGITIAAHISLGSYPIYKFGTEEQKRKFLTRLASGKTLGSFGLTEPDAGSDAGATKTTATLIGNEYLVNGSKNFITSALTGDIMICTAVADPSLGKKGIGAIIIEKGMPGFLIERKEDKLGLKASDTCVVILEECKVPAENLLGRPQDGFKIFLNTLDGGRISIGALSLGLAQGALDCAVSYAKKKDLLKGSSAVNQIMQKAISEMAADVAASRELVYQAAFREDRGLQYGKEGAIAKLFASEACVRVASRAIEVMGNDGLSKLYPAERIFRDTKLCTIGEGTSEILCIVIAREIDKEESSE